MKLKSLSLVELDVQESMEINGGSGPGTGYGTVNPKDWKKVVHAIGDFIDGFMEGL
ncbi:hypothetical protein ACR1PO_06915 [Chryseobacterium sp. RRHN12]|uniref:hypothetical protein n=1 Tax=Chryseobacterium sp. RRHN12 TaxID=3437884 RepID=UPI002FC78ACE